MHVAQWFATILPKRFVKILRYVSLTYSPAPYKLLLDKDVAEIRILAMMRRWRLLQKCEKMYPHARVHQEIPMSFFNSFTA